MLAVPLAIGLDAREVRLQLAARLYDHEQISLGVAARIAGLAYSEMIDELGRRDIAVIRLEPGELERATARSLTFPTRRSCGYSPRSMRKNCAIPRPGRRTTPPRAPRWWRAG